jgi:hypothetical protein
MHFQNFHENVHDSGGISYRLKTRNVTIGYGCPISIFVNHMTLGYMYIVSGLHVPQVEIYKGLLSKRQSTSKPKGASVHVLTRPTDQYFLSYE